MPNFHNDIAEFVGFLKVDGSSNATHPGIFHTSPGAAPLDTNLKISQSGSSTGGRLRLRPRISFSRTDGVALYDDEREVIEIQMGLVLTGTDAYAEVNKLLQTEKADEDIRKIMDTYSGTLDFSNTDKKVKGTLARLSKIAGGDLRESLSGQGDTFASRTVCISKDGKDTKIIDINPQWPAPTEQASNEAASSEGGGEGEKKGWVATIFGGGASKNTEIYWLYRKCTHCLQTSTGHLNIVDSGKETVYCCSGRTNTLGASFTAGSHSGLNHQEPTLPPAILVTRRGVVPRDKPRFDPQDWSVLWPWSGDCAMNKRNQADTCESTNFDYRSRHPTPPDPGAEHE
ncbi:uncharacterized protein MKK02DRAFT_29177 [Dioszegia hungarica]|uniref:Uncharacterized protein n=1 Tax=Dioszegia hungarica TaxID=4972 RepID=A0AA38H3A0_9TREE|nr:uncharacterized protein MKK02DRAFT_29177 [Dioszegia hungarica]KAI9633325.1 hypothetical protein MKK02DRAFT_29177 [Dioszegia hungarica]